MKKGSGMKKIILYVIIPVVLLLLACLGYWAYMAENGPSAAEMEYAYASMVKEGGAGAAIDAVKGDYGRKRAVKEGCHQIMHAIGRAAVWDGKSNLSAAFADGDSFCWSGYYHGVMEGLLYEMGSTGLGSITTVCSGIGAVENYSFNYYNCVHGLGHGVMYVNGNELFISLEACRALGGWWERESCYGGVFMENIISTGKYHQTDYLKEDDLLYPCDAVDAEYKYACYLMQASWMLSGTGGDFGKVFALCRGIEPEFRTTCFQSLGREASGYNYGHPSWAKRLCLLGKKGEEQEYCIIGAAMDMVSYYHSTDEAMEFCALFRGNISEECGKVVGFYATYGS